MKKTIEWVQQCESCDGTGLYVGMAERDGAAVVCNSCEGTGREEMCFKYDEFTHRKKRKNVKRVFQSSAGRWICIGEGKGFKLEDFGGIPYTQWLTNDKFPKRGTEDRKHTCPAWYYQSVDYDRKPNWDECLGLGSFSDCKHFPEKHKCWEKFDKKKL